jgi:hypothetical protein
MSLTDMAKRTTSGNLKLVKSYNTNPNSLNGSSGEGLCAADIDANLEIIDAAISSGVTPSGRSSIHQPSVPPDGNRKIFDFASLPNVGSYLLVWNGQVLSVDNDFTQSGSAVTTVQTPQSGDSFWAFY